MGKPALIALLAAVAVTFAACDSKKETPPPAKASSGPAKAKSAAPAARERDLSGLQLCEIVKGAEVVKIAGGAKLAAPATSVPRGCMYVVERPGGGADHFNLRVESASLEAMLIDHLEPQEQIEKVAGPWDDARLSRAKLGGGLRLMVVRRGDLGIEVAGERKEAMIEIAKLASSRIPKE
jgi:hypothetical protein